MFPVHLAQPANDTPGDPILWGADDFVFPNSCLRRTWYDNAATVLLPVRFDVRLYTPRKQSARNVSCMPVRSSCRNNAAGYLPRLWAPLRSVYVRIIPFVGAIA